MGRDRLAAEEEGWRDGLGLVRKVIRINGENASQDLHFAVNLLRGNPR
jgi:hypothetical protein